MAVPRAPRANPSGRGDHVVGKQGSNLLLQLLPLSGTKLPVPQLTAVTTFAPRCGVRATTEVLRLLQQILQNKEDVRMFQNYFNITTILL